MNTDFKTLSKLNYVTLTHGVNTEGKIIARYLMLPLNEQECIDMEKQYMDNPNSDFIILGSKVNLKAAVMFGKTDHIRSNYVLPALNIFDTFKESGNGMWIPSYRDIKKRQVNVNDKGEVMYTQVFDLIDAINYKCSLIDNPTHMIIVKVAPKRKPIRLDSNIAYKFKLKEDKT